MCVKSLDQMFQVILAQNHWLLRRAQGKTPLSSVLKHLPRKGVREAVSPERQGLVGHERALFSCRTFRTKFLAVWIL